MYVGLNPKLLADPKPHLLYLCHRWRRWIIRAELRNVSYIEITLASGKYRKRKLLARFSFTEDKKFDKNDILFLSRNFLV